ncbi:helix-turn-helix domain-containing protein [Bacteroidales bacterium OttesenSCG-928-K03]|nr:helix-turn-helix domain-containing protein [Bacteroidales bacterium OttesenSCG-928-K03]
MDNKSNRITISDLESDDSYSIKNFVLVENDFFLKKISNNDPFVFSGIALGLCLRGKAKIKINFKEYEMKPNTITVIMPNQVITILDRSDDFFIEQLFVSVDFIAGLILPLGFDIMNNIGHLPCIEVPDDAMEDLIEYYAMIVKQFNQFEQPYRVEIVKGLFYVMILEMMGLYAMQEGPLPSPSSRIEEINTDFFKYLRRYYKQERNVAFYADKLCITPKYLSSIIKEVTGASALSWIHEIIIVEAKMLLKTTDMTVLQISDELNFSNPSFFGNFFKEHVGMTPLEFREAL